MSEPVQTVQTEEVSLFDERARKTIFGLLNSPLGKMILGNAKSKADGVRVSDVTTDEAGVHFVLVDTKLNKTRKVIVTKADLSEIIRFVME